jgi:ammonium transporter, Amt family
MEGNTAWVLASAALVLFMTPGLAFFYGGMVRSKNVLGMLMQNFFSMGLVSVLWAVVVFSLAFGGTGKFVGDFSFVGLKTLGNVKSVIPAYAGRYALAVPPLAFVAFQLMFAIITPALITGAIADRMKFRAWVVFLGAWLVLVYAPVAHWVFAPVGWLFTMGALDFAGGTVVHINAGIAALAVVLVLGRRKGWPDEQMPPHSLPLTLLGTGILWFGWFGFNAGSALGANILAVHSLVNTQIGGAAGLAFWLLAERIKEGNVSSLGGASGAIAGLAAITPAAGFVGPLPALVFGALAGVICFYATRLKFVFHYDDALDVVGVHLAGGVLGMLLLSLFSTKGINASAENGLFYGGGVHLVWLQALAVAVVFAYAFILSFIIGKAIDKTIGLRVTAEEEDRGLDISHLVETAYQPPWFETGEDGELGL